MAPAKMPSRIDIHSHFLPDFYQSACRSHGHSHPDGMPYLPTWSPTAHLEMMDRIGISKSILSISSPGTHLVPGADTAARALTRRVNAYAAELKAAHPTRFGYFASLPLPDVAGSLEEIPRACAEGADGFALETNAHGHYLGDARFDPVFEELNRRRALVFVHPTTPKCVCLGSREGRGRGRGGGGKEERGEEEEEEGGEGHGGGDGADGEDGDDMVRAAAPLADKYPNPMLEFFFDTARVVAHLFLSGTMRRCPDVRFVLPHLGGAFVPTLARWTGFSELVTPVPPHVVRVSEREVRETLAARVWFDLAGLSFPGQIRATMAGAGITVDRMVYGSDFPFTRLSGVEDLRNRMDEGVQELFGEEEIERLYHGNAEKLLAMK